LEKEVAGLAICESAKCALFNFRGKIEIFVFIPQSVTPEAGF
jgi:hypothetical protein